MTSPIPPDARSEGPIDTPDHAAHKRHRRIIILSMATGGIALLAGAVWFFSDRIAPVIDTVLPLVTDRHQLTAWLESMGPWAPALFISVQILQVIFAPVPGEATGVIGGFLFGIWPGFLYSSIGLSLGSWINLTIGRVLGERVARRLIPERYIVKFDGVIARNGVWASLTLFIFPGFPKDYLCLALGISRLPIWLLLIIASVGRLPGTLMLSIQGAALGGGQWSLLTVVTLVTILVLLISFRYRSSITNWVRQRDDRPFLGR